MSDPATVLTDDEYDAMPWPYGVGMDHREWTPAIIEWAESLLAARTRAAQAAALRDAADAVYGDERAAGDFPEPLSIVGWLRARADRLEANE